MNLLPKNWNLLAIGADLVRDDPLTKSLSYTRVLGVVDSGLSVGGNPDAGARLARSSPENDSDPKLALQTRRPRSVPAMIKT